jgi:hypothetical protein
MACSFVDETDIDQGREQNHGFNASNPVQQTTSGASTRQAAGLFHHRSLAIGKRLTPGLVTGSTR